MNESNIVSNPLERKALFAAMGDFFACKLRWGRNDDVYDLAEFVAGWIGHCNHASLDDALDAREDGNGERETVPFVDGHTARAVWTTVQSDTTLQALLIDAIRCACDGREAGYVSVVVRDVMTTLGLRTTKAQVFAMLRAMHERGEIELRAEGPKGLSGEDLQFCPNAPRNGARWVFVRIMEAA